MPPTPLRRPAGAFVLSLLLAVAGPSGLAAAASAVPVAAKNGMVVSAQHLATEAGVEVLKKGGNAIDAAVAVGYALAVVYPAAGNLGGGGFMTLQLADGRKTFFDFREKAPLAATPGMYLDAAGNVIRHASTQGHLAVAVPGTVAGLEAALAKYGTMKRAELIAPAIRLAEQGFVLEQGDADMLAAATAELRTDPATRGDLPQPGPPLGRGRPAGAARPRGHPPADRRGRRRRLLQGAGGRGARRLEPRRQGLDHPGRPRPLHEPGAGADRMRLPRLPHRLGAAAELGRGRPVRDAQHPRGLSAQGLGLSLGRRRACADRGDASCLPRPQHPRRSRLRRQSGDAAHRQGLCDEGPRRHRPAAGGAVDRPQGRHAAARGQQHHPLLDRRRQGQRGGGDLHPERLVRRQGHRRRHRSAPEQRDGRLHRQGRHGQPVRPDAGRAEHHRPGQAAAELDDADDRHPGRQAR